MEDVTRVCCDVVNFSFSMDLVVPAGAVGKLIGRGGSNIRTVQAEHPSVRIQGPRRGATVPVFRVQGTDRDAVQAAISTLQRGVNKWHEANQRWAERESLRVSGR